MIDHGETATRGETRLGLGFCLKAARLTSASHRAIKLGTGGKAKRVVLYSNRKFALVLVHCYPFAFETLSCLGLSMGEFDFSEYLDCEKSL